MASLTHPHETKPLWLIKPQIQASQYRDQLMGSIVKYPDRPIESHIPYHAPKPLEMVMDLDPKPVPVHNVQFWSKKIKDARVYADVNNLLDFFMERAAKDSSERKATIARMWHMDSPAEKFKELLKNEHFRKQLVDLLRANDNKGYFVTEVVTFVNLETKAETSSSHGLGASAKVPVDPSLTGMINVGAGAKLHAGSERGSTATYEDEMIVFLGYRRVRLEKVNGFRAKLKRIIPGNTRGILIRDDMNYWPEIEERPVEGNAEFMGRPTGGVEEDGDELRESQVTNESERDEVDIASEEIIKELGFDVEIVG